MGVTLLHSQQTETIKLKTSEISYTVYGEGKPILIINGGPGMNSDGFETIAKTLSKTHQAIIYDQRGTGRSEIDIINRSTMTMELMLRDIETIRTHLNIESWIIFGHSFGGMLGSFYASKFPERVSAMILSSSGGMDLSLLRSLDIRSALTETQQDSLAFWTQKINNGDSTYQTRYQRGKYLAPAYLYDQSLVNVVAHRLTQGNMQINSLIWQDMQRINFDCKNQLKSFTKPVLIIQGKQDIIDKSIAQTADKVFQNSTLVYVDKSAHYGWLEQPELYFDSVNLFLSNLASK
ncbi:MAG: alpha/beta fold hydrolase [Winogradskyella sp.]|uniref:alpha/beta fold hydrolase n=1 Tax=Winogradskyella sp. TaxID=1883156 RepID=UPI001845C351|nr:alpha/beta fold hydrolase [Winogradskyella sp.]